MTQVTNINHYALPIFLHYITFPEHVQLLSRASGVWLKSQLQAFIMWLENSIIFLSVFKQKN